MFAIEERIDDDDRAKEKHNRKGHRNNSAAADICGNADEDQGKNHDHEHQ